MVQYRRKGGLGGFVCDNRVLDLPRLGLGLLQVKVVALNLGFLRPGNSGRAKRGGLVWVRV